MYKKLQHGNYHRKKTTHIQVDCGREYRLIRTIMSTVKTEKTRLTKRVLSFLYMNGSLLISFQKYLS